MSLTSLLEKIAGKQQKRQQAKQAGYRKLVARIADGKEPEAAAVDRALRETNKTLEQLREDVELLQRRREFRRQYDAVEPLQVEQRGVEQQIAEVGKVLEEAQRQHDEATAPLYARLSKIKHAIRAGDQAKQQLWDTCADQSLLDRLTDVWERLKVATGRRWELRKEMADMRTWSESDLKESTREMMATRAVDLRERAEQRAARADECERALGELEETITELEHREKAIREQMLVP